MSKSKINSQIRQLTVYFLVLNPNKIKEMGFFLATRAVTCSRVPDYYLTFMQITLNPEIWSHFIICR